MQKYTKLLVPQKKVLPLQKKCVLLHPILRNGSFEIFQLSIFNFKSPGGGMVDTVDSKSAAGNGVRVQVPPGVQKDFASDSK